MKYESPAIDKDALSETTLSMELEKGIKYIPHNCPSCGDPASVNPNGSSFCRNETCNLKGWRF